MKKITWLILMNFIALAVVSCGPKLKESDIVKSIDANCSLAYNGKITPNLFIGMLSTRSNKFKILSLQINHYAELVLHDDQTLVEGVAAIKDIQANSCLAINYKKSGTNLIAAKIQYLPPLSEKNKELRIDLAALTSMVHIPVTGKEGFVLFDARPFEVYEYGTIPGAVHLPLAQLKANPSLLEPYKDKQIIFFCGGLHCNYTPTSAMIALKNGYKNVKIFIDGFPAWIAAGNMAVVTAEGVNRMVNQLDPVILIDIRQNANKFHIPNAVNILPKDIPKWKAKFPPLARPENKMTQIVVYGQNKDDDVLAAKVAKTILSWGYSNVSTLVGGFQAYRSVQGKVGENMLADRIYVQRKVSFGEISAADFAIKQKTVGFNEVIVDARSAAEFAAGNLLGSMNLPVNEITPDKLSLFKKYENIYIYCNTGVLAQIAYEKAVKFGFTNARYLKDDVNIEGNKLVIGRYDKIVIPIQGSATGGNKKEVKKVEGC